MITTRAAGAFDGTLGRTAAVCLTALAAAALPAAALDPDKAFHQFRLDAWAPEEGSAQGSTIAVVQTSDGYLWLGGYEGLDRFDGVRFTSFNRSNTPALRDDNIFALAEGADGSLWIGTDGGGLTRLRGGIFSTYTSADGLVDDRVYCLLPSRDGSLWIGTKGGLSRLEAGPEEAAVFTSYTTGDGLPSHRVMALAEDREGGLWIGTERGLARWRDGSLSVVSAADGLAGTDVSALLVDRTGDLWIGFYGAAVSRYRDGVFSNLDGNGRSIEDVTEFLEDGDGNLWIGTYGGGLFRLRGGQLTSHGLADGLTSDLVWDLAEDREGSLWIGTEGGGLMRLKDPPLVPVTTRDGLPYERILVVTEDAQGILWIGTDGGGLVKLEKGVFTTYSAQQGLASSVVSSLHRRRDGSLWIGTNRGVYRLHGGRITAELATEVGGASVKTILEDRRQRLWIGTDGTGLVGIGGSETTTYSVADGLPGDGVRVLAEDRRGGLWIGTDGGLARLERGEITAYADPGLAGAFVRAIHEDAEGTLWIGTRGSGLTRIRDREIVTFTSRDGLYSDVAYQILEDDRRNLWMTCAKGIFRVAMGDLEAFARGEISTVPSVAYGTADGMISPECGGGSQPAGWKTRDGKLWFPTNKGLVRIDPERLEPNRQVPPVYVERVLADGSSVGDSAIDPGQAVILPPGKGDLEFHYTALSFLDPAKVRFKYRLEGYDDGWVDAGTRRSAYFTNMPPGSYLFQVIASNNDGVWNETGARVALRLRPAFYQTWGFYLASALAAGLLARSVHRWRIRNLMRHNQALQSLHRELEAKNAAVKAKNAEIERFTYAVSHDLKSPLVTVLGFLGFLERDLAQGNSDRVAADIERIRNAATTMRQQLDELLDLSRIGRLDNPRERVDLGQLAFEALELVSGRIAARGVEVHISPALPVVTGDRARLLQLLQNLIDNAVKFMGTQSEARIEIGGSRETGDRQEVTCFVRDNGLGIDPEYHDKVFGLFNKLDAKAEGAGMGLSLVQRIVEVHGGRIWVESEGEGQGSTFFFTLPAFSPQAETASGSM